MNLPASSAGRDQPLAFTDAAACQEWLAKAPRGDAIQFHAMLLRQTNLLNGAALPATERLGILETLRDAVHAAQEDIARRFVGKPLPLTASEKAAFDSCRALWQGLAGGYMRCVEACLANEAGMKPKAALILQRAMAALVAEQFDTHRAGRAPHPGHWQVLHQLYAAGEQLDAVQQGVMDGPRLGKTPGSALATYIEALLLQAASLHEHSQRHVAWIARWARRWAPKVRLLAAPPTLSTRAIPLCVDLASDQPAGNKPLAGDNARWLETAELMRSLKKRLILLEQGESPASLHLGDDCTQPSCELVLKNVYQRWCKGGAIRGYERRPASGSCKFIGGAEAIHYYLSGSKPFKQPGAKDADAMRREREEIATFGRVSTHRDENFSEQQGYAVETWQMLENWHMVDASTTGMRLAHGIGQAGGRVGHGLLVAACPADAQDYLLGSVRWALQMGDETIQTGVHFFPGKPEPVAVRAADPGVGTEKYRQGFRLPEIAALKSAASIVLPVGSFKLQRIVEIFADGQSRKVRLTRLLERGADFERAAYEPA